MCGKHRRWGNSVELNDVFPLLPANLNEKIKCLRFRMNHCVNHWANESQADMRNQFCKHRMACLLSLRRSGSPAGGRRHQSALLILFASCFTMVKICSFRNFSNFEIQRKSNGKFQFEKNCITSLIDRIYTSKNWSKFRKLSGDFFKKYNLNFKQLV